MQNRMEKRKHFQRCFNIGRYCDLIQVLLVIPGYNVRLWMQSGVRHQSSSVYFFLIKMQNSSVSNALS